MYSKDDDATTKHGQSQTHNRTTRKMHALMRLLGSARDLDQSANHKCPTITVVHTQNGHVHQIAQVKTYQRYFGIIKSMAVCGLSCVCPLLTQVTIFPACSRCKMYSHVMYSHAHVLRCTCLSQILGGRLSHDRMPRQVPVNTSIRRYMPSLYAMLLSHSKCWTHSWLLCEA